VIAQVVIWWFVSYLIGLAALPLTWRIFNRLPDRGYGLSRALGLLISGYVLWMGASIGFLNVDSRSALGAVIVLATLSAVFCRNHWSELRLWLRDNYKTILAMEGVFLGTFLLWSFVRANNPDITNTEKPMELAFLNGILRSETFPPLDVWLSGHAISYYYFGYVLLAFLTRLTGVTAGVAFNLGNALWFALTALATYSLVYNLLTSRAGRPRRALALLGPLFLLLAGNLEGLLEVLHARFVFWTQAPDGTLTSPFWKWLDVEQLSNAPMISEPAWRPDRYLWWWRASRVVRDYNLVGNPIGIQPIDEFPFFSFLLADNHSHLLALPFVLLAISFSLQVFMVGKRVGQRLKAFKPTGQLVERIAFGVIALMYVVGVLRAGAGVLSGMQSGEALISGLGMAVIVLAGMALLSIPALQQVGLIPSFLTRIEFWFSAFLFGGLAFLNTWDFPLYFALLMAVLWWTGRELPLSTLLLRLASTALGVVIVGVLLYIPWYPTFSSQAGGILPNVAFTTRLPHFLIMFGTMFIPLGIWLVVKLWQSQHRGIGDAGRILLIGLGMLGLLLLVLLAATGLAFMVLQRDPGLMQQVIEGLGGTDTSTLIGAMIQRRLTGSWTSILMVFVLGAGIVLLMRKARSNQEHITENGRKTLPFVILLTALGAFLVLWLEFFYLRDFFGVRMNTMFKFYFATWILWSVAAAYASAELIPGNWAYVASAGILIVLGPQVFYLLEAESQYAAVFFWAYIGAWILWVLGVAFLIYKHWPPKRSWLRVLFVPVVMPVFLGLLYSVQGVLTRTQNFNPASGRTLDGTAYLVERNEDEYEAIQWIVSKLKPGVILEAVGGSYSEYGRISSITGFPTVLGWEYHEVQWRGDQHQEVIGSRKDDVLRIYEARDIAEAQALIDRYDVAYVYIGPLERQTYPFLSETRLEEFLHLVFRNRTVAIYAVPHMEYEP
jgi:uncharacterized membrane protein